MKRLLSVTTDLRDEVLGERQRANSRWLTAAPTHDNPLAHTNYAIEPLQICIFQFSFCNLHFPFSLPPEFLDSL